MGTWHFKDLRNQASSMSSRQLYSPSMPGHTKIAGLVKLLMKWRTLVTCFWLAAAAIAAPFAPRLLRDTELAFTPPGDSAAARATRIFAHNFPTISNVTNLVVLAETTDGSDIRQSRELRDYCFALNDTLWRKYGEDKMFDFTSYFTLDRLGVPAAMSAALLQQTKNGGTPAAHPTATIFVLTVRGSETSKGLIQFSENLRATMASDVLHGTSALAKNNVTLTLTGLPALYDGIMRSAIHDLETMDGIVLPLALCILALLVRSFRLLAIPLVCLSVSAALSFATVDGIAVAGIPILTAAPSLMCSVFIAMSIDYSMFLLTRFQEEKLRLELIGPSRTSWRTLPVDELRSHMCPVVEAVLGSSGKIVAASGSTLIICFLGLLFLPLNLMQSIGLSCAVSLIYTMTVNLTLCPALLFLFPHFFLDSCIPSFICGKTGVWSVGRSNSGSSIASEVHLLNDKAADASLDTMQSSAPTKMQMNITITDQMYDDDGDVNDAARRVRSTSRLSSTGLTNSPLPVPNNMSLKLLKKQREGFDKYSGHDIDDDDREDYLPAGADMLHRSAWYRLVSITQTWWGSLLVLTLVALTTILLGLNAFDGRLSAALTDYLPRGSSGRDALNKISAEFSSGTAYPYKLIVQVGHPAFYYNRTSGGRGAPANVTSVVEESFFDVMQPLLEDLVAETDSARGAFPNGTQIASYLYIMPGIGKVDYSIVKLAMTTPAALGALGFYLQNMVEREFSNRDKTAAVVEILLGVPPFSNAGREWIVHFRKRIEAASRDVGLQMEVSGFGGDVADSLSSVYAAWPLMGCMVACVVLLIVGLSFRSCIIALRGVLTIGLTIIFVSGLAKLVYVDGIFASLGFAGVAENTGLVWIVQPTIFPLLVGIALDYDIFLIGRIVELHEEGVSARNSIILGVASTGTIITAAGVIQALAFFGLMLSSIQVLNQLSFFLFFAVLFDTFVVRTFVVPSIMFWLGRANFW